MEGWIPHSLKLIQNIYIYITKYVRGKLPDPVMTRFIDVCMRRNAWTKHKNVSPMCLNEYVYNFLYSNLFSSEYYIFLHSIMFHENIICDTSAIFSKRPTKLSELFLTGTISLGIVDCHDNIDHVREYTIAYKWLMYCASRMPITHWLYNSVFALSILAIPVVVEHSYQQWTIKWGKSQSINKNSIKRYRLITVNPTIIK